MFHRLGCHLLTKTSFWGVSWVDVSTETLAESGFLDIAGRLQVPAKTLEEARQALANLKERWLLILDNADDPKVDYQRYFPTGLRGVVMLTSRNDECRHTRRSRSLLLTDSPTVRLENCCSGLLVFPTISVQGSRAMLKPSFPS